MNLQSAAWLVWLHAGVASLHGLAHLQLGVFQPMLNSLYIVLVIGLAPFGALWLLRRGKGLPGAALLTLSMLGALLYGLFYHFLHESPDHIHHLPEGNPLLFQVTALLILLLEGLGLLLGLGLCWQAAQASARGLRYG